MNISKLSNESANWPSDWGVINAAHQLSTQTRSFNQDEVAILEPDIVIAMNLGNKMASLGHLTPIADSQVKSFWLDSGGHRSLLIDAPHFSAVRGTNDIRDYYDPICAAIRRAEGR